MTTDNFNPPNSVWPNGLKRDEEGYVTFYPLGTNKVDISTITWPEGDKLVSPFVYQNDKLVGFVDTKSLTVSGSATTTMNYNHIEADFASIPEGKLTVNAPNAIVKKFTWSVVDNGGSETVYIRFEELSDETKTLLRSATTIRDNILYDENNNVIGEFNTNVLLTCHNMVIGEDGMPEEDESTGMAKTTNGKTPDALFLNLDSDTEQLRGIKLVIFDSDLSSLTSGYGMFFSCENLNSFTSDLSSLTDGCAMFNSCNNLNSFTSDLSSLTYGLVMFINCDNLKLFSSDLSSLTNGYGMFYNCINLTSFTSDLSSLTDGTYMFFDCSLDASSVKNIIDTINAINTTNIYSAPLTLGMGCNNATGDINRFAQEVGYADMASLLAALQAKGWFVEAQYNGRPTTTYGLRRPSEDTLPVYVKLEEVEDYADYTSLDNSKKFKLNWFHETTGSTEGYTQYATLEEAIEALNIKPIERN